MFGYIRAERNELRVRELETYKAVYCSLCKKLGKSYGVLSRLTLSYDFTFLALLSMSVEDNCVTFERKRCPFNPLKKCNYCKDLSALDMPAAAAMIMMYYKLLDNINDENGIKRLGFWLLKPLFGRARKKAAGLYPQIEQIVADYIAAQGALEKENCRSLDMAADPTARAMAELFMLCSVEESQKRVLNRLGYCIGRYIYLLDAACDFFDDLDNGSYNVLKDGSGEYATDYPLNRVREQLYFCINEAGRAFELLNIKKYKSILGNIIYLGLEDTFNKELNK